jgi:predicted permease
MVQDVRFALRLLGKSRGFTTVAIVTLAIGIGATAAVFSILNSLLLRRLPVSAPERLGIVSSGADSRSTRNQLWTHATWRAIRHHAGAFDGAFAWSPGGQMTVSVSAAQHNVPAVYASGRYFDTLGIHAAIGRTFTDADDVPGGGPDGPVAVISYRLWQRLFDRKDSAVGTAVGIEGVPFTIVGVTSPDFFGVDVGRFGDLTIPLDTEPLIRGTESRIDDALITRWLRVMLRLKPGQSVEAAAATLRALQPEIRAEAMPVGPLKGTGGEFLKEPFAVVGAATGASGYRDQYRRLFLIILCLVALVLVVACSNIGNLLLARAAARRREFAVRLALGATRWRLARQQFVESLLLAAAGTAAGVFIAAWVGRGLLAILPQRLELALAFDARVTLFTMAVSAATAVLFGTVPAFRAARVAPLDALKGVPQPTGWLLWRRWRRSGASTSSGLIFVQVALSLVLVLAAGLLVTTFRRLAAVPTGIDADRVVVLDVDASRASITPAQRVEFFQRLARSVTDVPGVAHAAASIATPAGSSTFFEVIVSRPGAQGSSDRTAKINFVTPGWFATFGVPIRRGRDLRAGDTSSAAPAIVVNDAFVRTFFPDRDALGETVNVAAGGGQLPMGVQTIVGVAGDTVAGSLRDGMPPIVYVPVAQWAFPVPMFPRISVSLRPRAGSPSLLVASATAALKAIDPKLTVNATVVSNHLAEAISQERMVARLSSVLGATALLLAGLGIYGVTSYAAVRRRSEIGVRIALGATRRGIVGLMMASSLAVAVAGVIVGLAVAAIVTRYLRGMLFGVTPLDPATFAVVTLLFLAIAALAAFIPAFRSTTVDPAAVLRRDA